MFNENIMTYSTNKRDCLFGSVIKTKIDNRMITNRVRSDQGLSNFSDIVPTPFYQQNLFLGTPSQ